MKFFKLEDFTSVDGYDFQIDPYTAKVLSDMANAKLEKEGKVVFQHKDDKIIWQEYKNPFLAMTQDCQGRNKALLISTEHIEECKHEYEKVRLSNHNGPSVRFTCSCGKRVTPSVFKERK